MKQFALKLDRALLAACGVFAKLGSLFLMVIMLVTVCDVVLRRFRSGVPGAVEIVEYAMALVAFLSIGYIQASKRNITTALLYDRLPAPCRAFIDVVGSLAVLALYGALTYATVLQTAYLFRVKETSSVLGIPKYPFVGATALGFGLLSAVLLADFLVVLAKLGSKDDRG